MSRFAAADRIRSAEECQTQECQTQEGRHASENTGLNTVMNPPKERQLSCRQLISDAVKARANKFTFAERNNISPLDIAVQACDVKYLDIFLDCVDLDEKVKTRMVSNAYTNFFYRNRNFRQFTDSHISMVKRLLELGADVDGGPEAFPVCVATIAGSYPLVELLCRHGADLNNSQLIRVEVVLKFGVNIHEIEPFSSPLDLALTRGHIKCAELLMRHGANFNVKFALRDIIYKQSVDHINFLLVYCRQEFNQYILENQQNLLMLAVGKAHVEFISHILDLFFEVTGEYPCWEKLLAQSKNEEVATFLIRKGADVNKMIETSCGSYTPLHLVLWREDMCPTSKLGVVKVLLENGASHICFDTMPLMLVAITRDSTDLIQLLLDYEADINWRARQLSCRQLISDAVKARANKFTFAERNSISPLDIAVQACDVKYLDIFLDCVDLDEKVKTRMVNDAYTNFFYRNRNFRQFTDSHISMVKRLLELGADVDGGPEAFPVCVATTAGSYPLVELLCRHGADLNKTNWYPPLIKAVERGHYDIIEVMLKFGVNIHEETQLSSPLDLALTRGHIKCAELLMRHGAKFRAKFALRDIIYKQSVDHINFLLVYCRQEFNQYILENQQNLLMLAVGKAHVEFISHILDLFFEVTGEYPCWEKLLAQSKNEEVATFLIRKGADVNKMIETSCGSYTPLHLVLWREDMCPTSKLGVVKVLLENGASHICFDTMPLMLVAITRDSTDLIQLLLDYEADINWRARQLSCRQLISDAVKARANKFTFAERNSISPLDIAVQACDVKYLDIFLDCVDLDEKVKTRMVNDAYTNFFYRNRNFRQFTDSHISMVKRLLELGADVDGGPEAFPVCVATTAGSYPLVELLCRHGADLNKTNWYPPLIKAVERGHYDIIEVMLKFGVNIHEETQLSSPLDLALTRGHIKCAELLMRHGAKFRAKFALRDIIYKQSVDHINFLLVYCRDEFNQYILENQQNLLMSAVRVANVEFISHILDLFFEVTGEYPCWEKLLAQSKNEEVATFLIRKGADVNKMIETSCGSYTPLHLVLCREDMCHTYKLEVVKVFLENGAFHICCDTMPLMLVAIIPDSTELIQLLLDYGADINWRDSAGETAFSYSVYQGCHSNAEFLLRYANKDFINAQNSDGWTVLMQAVRYSNVAVVKGVINHNPDVNMTDNKGNTALLHAINRIFDDNAHGCVALDIVITVINSGCNVNLQNDDGLSPLMLAASRHSSKIMQILLDAGADINAVSEADRTKTAVSYFEPVSFIQNRHTTACLELFLSRGACLSYLQPKMFHRILFCDSDTICKIITNGPGPVTVWSDEYFSNYFSPTDRIFDVSPLCSALVRGNISLARHFVDIMFLTKCDLTSLMHNKPVRAYLEKENHTECLNLLDAMSLHPVSLFRLAFVEVSSAVGTTLGRGSRVNMLPLPRLVKDKLLFKSAVDFTIPIIDDISFRLLSNSLDRTPKIRLVDCCKCCWVWQNLKFKNRLREGYMYDGLCSKPAVWRRGCECNL